MALPDRYAYPVWGGEEDVSSGIMVGIPMATTAFWLADLQRAPDIGTNNPDTGNAVIIATDLFLGRGASKYVDRLPVDQQRRFYRFRYVAPGYQDGAWGPWTVGIKPVRFDADPEQAEAAALSGYPIVRAIPMTDGEYIAQAEDTLGQTLPSVTKQSDGVTARSLAKGHQQGTAQHGDSVTFATAYQNPPLVLLKGGIVYEPRSGSWTTTYSSTLPQYIEQEALNLTASGFTVRARLRQKGSPTAQSDEFGASNALDTDGESTTATLVPAGATSDQYTIHYSVRIRVTCPGSGTQSGGVTVAIDTDDGGGGGFVERLATAYSADATAGAGGCIASAYARPDSTTIAFNSGSHLSMDEVSPSDSDFASLFVDEPGGPVSDFAEVTLSNVTDPASSTGHIIRVRHRLSAEIVGTVEVRLYQGATLKATFMLNSFATTFSTESYTLSGTEADSITDYTDLKFYFSIVADSGDENITWDISWAEFEVPAAAVYNETNWTHEQKVITVSGLGSGDAVRVRIKSVQNSGNLNSFLVHAFDGTGDPASGVTYNTSTDHYASQTPDAADRVNWEAVEVT